ncbi:MAG: NAD(P)/FAD-dependent oxidoreductase [Clostridia bacterium]
MKVIVIGAGASGLMAAGTAAFFGAEVVVLEGAEKCGKKVYLTGKGRCNVTNSCSEDEFFKNIVSNPKFLYSSLNQFSQADTIDFFEKHGVKLKIERGNRVFPISDKSSDISGALLKNCKSNSVKVVLNAKVTSIMFQNDNYEIKTADGQVFYCDRVIIATGGKSYPLTGSTGDGYFFAKSFGHTIERVVPALVPIRLKGDYVKQLEGVSLKNVSLLAFLNNKPLKTLFGEMIFTDKGISGPIALSMSSYINREKEDCVKLFIDFKPALSFDKLDARIVREFEDAKNKNISNVISSLLPHKLIDVFLNECEIDSDLKINSVTKVQREMIVKTLKQFPIKFAGLFPVECAIISSGGVAINEINPKTLESKLQKGLYFAGEVINVDALTGGFNLQIAFSTGFVAGKSSATN